ncbi:hypothetical protein GVO57_11025 [Sphingomonas changnyeongensis]|uniref:Uncharacterized protein n=1 Tax=Sphingomonas changnyeongensis TaxID=2698679 RepID=A0A7Z2S8B8_9SPHN|nr:hypothetical protein [Sphingomonas changnyeongensis]QHL91246.1 hypothetical protein GVO57_11025 [Sphingomonas changnyeongensis]
MTETVRALLQTAILIERKFTAEQVAHLSGLKLRAIRSYMANDPAEIRETPLSSALSIAVVLGGKAVNSILALIGYGGATPLDEPDEISPGVIVAQLIEHTAPIAQAAADGRIDHVERPITRAAADKIIAAVLPLSSMADAG